MPLDNVAALPLPAPAPVAEHSPPPSDSASAPTQGERGRKRSKPKGDKSLDWSRYNRLMHNFVLIYGTDTVYDCESRLIMKINALRLAFGHDYVKLWLADDARRMILPDELVFDPTETCQPPCINLFDGFAMEPRAGDCKPILELLHHLCAESVVDAQGNPDEVGVVTVMAWVLRWLAIPLQRPGTKMRSALVFHGPQGAGKNLMFEIMAAIYGKYARVVGQEQLDSQFNDFASQKMLLIGDEVMSRAELYHQKNKLKGLITGETIQINTKMLPLREERNHINVVFLSNELQPLALEVGDRRYFVVYTPPRREDDLYKRVAACLAQGGAAAFYDYLLRLDLNGQTEFDIPPMTRAKEDLIELGLKPSERFVRDWMAGYLPLPMRVCSTEQLYRAFKRWCMHTGERFPPAQVTFSKGVEKASRDRLRCEPVKLDREVNGKGWLRIWVPGEAGPPEGYTRGEWARECVEAFEDDLRRFTEDVSHHQGHPS